MLFGTPARYCYRTHRTFFLGWCGGLMLCVECPSVNLGQSSCRLDYQPLFEKGVRTSRGGCGPDLSEGWKTFCVILYFRYSPSSAIGDMQIAGKIPWNSGHNSSCIRSPAKDRQPYGSDSSISYISCFFIFSRVLHLVSHLLLLIQESSWNRIFLKLYQSYSGKLKTVLRTINNDKCIT